MTSNDTKSYLGHQNDLVDEQNDSYYRSIDRDPVEANYCTMIKEIESSYKAPQCKAGD